MNLEKRNLLFNSSHTAIDWDRNHVRILHFAKDGPGRIKVLRAVQADIPSDVAMDNAEQMGGFIQKTLRDNSITSSSIVLMVGRERAFLHQLTIPASPDAEVANLVRFQLAQELPFAIEESTVDYIVTARNDAGLVIGVLAAAVQTEYIDFLRRLARAGGLSLKRVGLRSYGHYLAVKTAGSLDDGLYLFSDLGLAGMEIDIFSKEGGLVYSRSTGLGDEDVNATPLKQAFLEQAVLHVKRTLHAQTYLAGTPEARPHRIIVSGCTGWESEFLSLICSDLGLEGKVFELPDGKAMENSSAFTAVYGIACAQFRPRQEHIDFLFPKKAIDPQAIKTRQIRLAVAAVAAILILAGLLTHSSVAEKERQLKDLRVQKKALDKELGVLKKFDIQVQKISEWGNRKVNWLEEMKALTQLLPTTDKMYLKNLFLVESTNPEYQADITLEGQAKSRQIIDQMAKKLADTGRYEVIPGPQITLANDEYSENFKFSLKVNRLEAESGSNAATTQPASSSQPAKSETPNQEKATPGKTNKSEALSRK
jgi:Tfp pilus assembly PilM family ATPase